jgi:hypothetical protein
MVADYAPEVVRVRATVTLTLLLGAAAACLAAASANSSAGLGMAPIVRTVQSPRGLVIRSLVWVDAQQGFVISAGSKDDYTTTRLYVGGTKGSSWRRVPDDGRSECKASLGLFPTSYRGDGFAFVAGCLGPNVPLDALKRIEVYSFTTRAVRTLRTYGLPFPARAFAFDPAGDRGVINDGTGLSERLRWLGAKSLSVPLRLPLDRVGDPVWSPDGRTIVVPGVTGPGGSVGAERVNHPWGLWALDVKTLRLTKIASNLGQLNRGAWIDAGSVYAVNLPAYASSTELTLVDIRTGRRVAVRSGTAGDVVRTSDHTVATMIGTATNRIVVLDLREGLRKLLAA